MCHDILGGILAIISFVDSLGFVSYIVTDGIIVDFCFMAFSNCACLTSLILESLQGESTLVLRRKTLCLLGSRYKNLCVSKTIMLKFIVSRYLSSIFQSMFTHNLLLLIHKGLWKSFTFHYEMSFVLIFMSHRIWSWI